MSGVRGSAARRRAVASRRARPRGGVPAPRGEGGGAASGAGSAPDPKQPLSPAGLELLATAAWWTGQLPLAIETRERAFADASKAGDYLTAVEVAINLARDYVFKLAMPNATAWIKRAEKMLEGLDEN